MTMTTTTTFRFIPKMIGGVTADRRRESVLQYYWYNSERQSEKVREVFAAGLEERERDPLSSVNGERESETMKPFLFPRHRA
jgi:hypothetical protein